MSITFLAECLSGFCLLNVLSTTLSGGRLSEGTDFQAWVLDGRTASDAYLAVQADSTLIGID